MAKDKIKKTDLFKVSADQKLESLTRQELVKLAKELKIKNYSRLSKVELLTSINNAEVPEKVVKKAEQTLPNVKLPKTKKLTLPVSSMDEKNIVSKTNSPKGELVKLQQQDSSVGNPEAKLPGILKINHEPADFETLSRQELVDIAKKLSIKNYSRLSKTRLIKLISEIKAAKVSSGSKKKKQAEQSPKKAEKDNKTISVKADITLESPEVEELEQAELIERISQHLKSPYVDEREARAVAEENKNKFLLRPSRFPKGKINKEYLLDEEENLEYPDLYEENKIVLLPVDPFNIYTYWNLNSETLKLIEELDLQQLVLKINDVSNIVYNGNNAINYWFESCLALAKNWYILLPDGDKNLIVEIGFVHDGMFNIIATSNTIYVPRRNPSTIVEDKFVIVTYPEVDPKKENLDLDPLPGKTSSFYGLYEQNNSENYNNINISNQVPVFSFQEDLPSHFVKEYEITGPVPGGEIKSNVTLKLPDPIPVNPEVKSEVIQQRIPQVQEIKQINTGLIFSTREKIPQLIKEQFEYYANVDGGKIIVDHYYYEIPGQEQKIIKINYQWYEEGVPYSKEFYWSSDVVPEIHEKIYKISWGPTWVKEFIGGSEHIRFLGASERFIGGSEMFVGGSERFLGSSGKFLESSEIFFTGGSEQFMGASEIFLGGSEKFIGGSERFIGASEQFIGGSEQFIGASEMSFRAN